MINSHEIDSLDTIAYHVFFLQIFVIISLHLFQNITSFFLDYNPIPYLFMHLWLVPASKPSNNIDHWTTSLIQHFVVFFLNSHMKGLVEMWVVRNFLCTQWRIKSHIKDCIAYAEWLKWPTETRSIDERYNIVLPTLSLLLKPCHIH